MADFSLLLPPLAPCGRGVFCQTAQILNKQNHPLTLTLSPGEGTDTNSSPAGEDLPSFSLEIR